MSGRVLKTTTFRLGEAIDRALGSLIAMGKELEQEGYDYYYHIVLANGKFINCNEKPYCNILEFAEHFHTIPIEEDMGGEYKEDDLVFPIDLQQIVRGKRRDPETEDKGKGEGKCKG